MSSNKKTLIDGDFQVGSAHFYVDVENNRVGLNQVNPTSSLDVNGNAFIGTDMTVASNVTVGSNVIAQKFTGSAAGLTSVPADQISGVIPVENGGTGTTATTGTGSLVKSDNPTFTGTVTADTFSGSGASLTNIPMGQATGTLAVANGGTGVTTSTGTGNTVLSASPTLTGTVTAETGNFSSNVSASNIYAGYDTDMTSYLGRAAVGFSGISDEATFAHVDVNSTNNYALKQTATGGTYVNSATSKSTIFSINDSEQARINVTGLGVGTNDPLHKLDVHGTANVGALTCTTISGDGYLLSNVSGYSWPTHINGNDIYYTTGNVGIGTDTPGNTLEVAGTASVAILKSAADAATSTYNYILNGPRPGTTSSGAIHFINGSTRTSDGGASTYTIRNDSGALRLGNASYNTLLEGNVGIGVTDPGTALDVNGTVTATTFSGALSNNLTPGSYLTGNAYNGSTARTFSVDATTTNTASKIVARDSNGDIFGRYLHGSYMNMSHGAADRNSDTVFYSSTDNYIRKNTASGMRSSLGLANSATITASVSAGNSTIVQRHSSGYIFANYFNTTPNDVTSGITKVCVETGNDGYIRHGTQAAVRSFLGLGAYAYKGDSSYNIHDGWLRENGDNATFKIYGNSRQVVFRTDGTTEYASGIGGYPFAWMYGGDSSGNRRMLLNTSGQLWCSNYGWLHDKFAYKAGTASQNFSVNTIYIGNSTSRGLRSVSGDYGTVQTTGDGAGDWEGYSINGRYVFMSSDANSCGIYNDLDNEWMVYCYRNGITSLYFNGSEKCRTQDTGLYMSGTPEMDGYIRHRGDTDCYMGFVSTDRWGVFTSNSERLRVDSGGGLRVFGIEGGGNYVSGNRGYFKGGVTTDPPNLNFGLYVQYYSRSSGHVSFSDRRIKSNIVDINDTYALDQLRGLQPKYYNYVDTKGRGDESVIGFIAQEVKEVVPRAVSILDGEIPNIYTHANITSNNTVTFTDFNTSNLESDATTIIVYDRGTHRKELEIAEIVDEHTIRFIDDISDLGCSFDENGNVITVTETITLTPKEYKEAGSPSDCTSNITGYKSGSNVVSIEEYELLTVKATYSPVVDFYTRVVTTYPGTEIFVWGQKVDDFHHLNKDYLWTIGTAALQEVDRQQQADKVRISELETQLASVLTRLDALESA
mgnify:FL=1